MHIHCIAHSTTLPRETPLLYFVFTFFLTREGKGPHLSSTLATHEYKSFITLRHTRNVFYVIIFVTNKGMLATFSRA